MILAGTGHRPPRLGLDYSEQSNKILKDFCLHILRIILTEKTIKNGISGGATGFDMALGEAFLDLGVAVTLALPCHGFGSQWPSDGQKRLAKLQEASKVVYTDEHPYRGPWQYAKRDKYMVDHADEVVALYDGTVGTGTGITVTYANSKLKPVLNIWDSWLSFKDKQK